MGRRQFKDFYQAAFTGMRPEAFAFYDHLFRAYDEDSSGTLDFKEFIQVSVQRRLLMSKNINLRSVIILVAMVFPVVVGRKVTGIPPLLNLNMKARLHGHFLHFFMGQNTC